MCRLELALFSLPSSMSALDVVEIKYRRSYRWMQQLPCSHPRRRTSTHPHTHPQRMTYSHASIHTHPNASTHTHTHPHPHMWGLHEALQPFSLCKGSLLHRRPVSPSFRFPCPHCRYCSAILLPNTPSWFHLLSYVPLFCQSFSFSSSSSSSSS